MNISNVSLPSCNAVVSYLSNNCFKGDLNISETIQEYNEGTSIGYFVENIAKNIKTRKTEEFIKYLSESIRTIPSLATCDLRQLDGLRKVFLFINDNPDLFTETPTFIIKIRTISSIALINICRLLPVNVVDPITLDEIEQDDLFWTPSGQQFSIQSLVRYHNTRDYRGTQGELFAQRFIVNPITNDFFSFEEMQTFIIGAAQRAVRTNEELLYLHPSAILPRGRPVPKIALAYRSLNVLYLSHKIVYRDRISQNRS